MTTIFQARSRTGQAPYLTKKYYRDQEGRQQKSDYDRAFLFDAYKLDVSSIDDLHDALSWLEDEPHACLIRGETCGETQSIRRTLNDCPDRGPATIRPVADGLQWVMLDFDKIPVSRLNLADEAERLAFLIRLLPDQFLSASFHFQWSSSAGMDNWKTLSCHLWYWLEEPWLCRTLFERFHDGDLADCEVDPAPFTPNQIHYTARPIFFDVEDPVERRSGFVRGSTDCVRLLPWVRRLELPPELPRDAHFKHSGLSRFEALLKDVGPRFHHPILRAAAHYFAVTPSSEVDEMWLEQRLRETIRTATPGRNRKENYLDRSYLNRVIRGARKFGRA